MSIFNGSGVALVTPFTQDGIALDTLAEMIDFQLENHTDAIIVCGTTGEPSTMSPQEKQQVIRFTVERVAGRVPVIAGTGGNHTAAVIEASIAAQALGVDGLLIVTPYYNKTTPSGLVAHYRAICQRIKLPVIVYNVPIRTGMNIQPETLEQLSGIPHITAIKEASANISQIVEMVRLCRGRLDFYAGNDDHVIPFMSLGAKGVISVIANIAPRDSHEMVARYLAGDLQGALDLQLKLNALHSHLFRQTSPIPVKTALRMMGFDVGPLRLPLTDLTEDDAAVLRTALIEYGLPLKGV